MTLWAHSELSMKLQLTLWACCELFVRSSQWVHHTVVAVRSMWQLQTHVKLTASSQCELILWVHCELTECPQNEPTVSFNVSSQWISCELKFFTRNRHEHQQSNAVNCTCGTGWNSCLSCAPVHPSWQQCFNLRPKNWQPSVSPLS